MNTKQHIILVEDDRRLSGLIRDYLEKNDFQVTTAERGDIAITLIRQFQPDLVILDIMLPEEDGFSVCRKVRPDYSGPILMLTAMEEDVNQLEGFEAGADDYVKKPVEPEVLLARLNAILRRSQPAGGIQNVNTLNFGNLKICKSSRTVVYDQTPVDLSSTEFDLLLFLAEAAGFVITREQLFSTLRGIEYDGLDRTVDVNISKLRRKLGDSSSRPRKIKTVWGQGYLFVPDAWY